MMRFLKWILPFFCIFSLGLATQDVYCQLTDIERSKVDQTIESWNKNVSPGLALGIIKEGQLIYSRGYGMADIEHDVSISDSTIFYIGSVSKQFVTMCVLLLEEQGKLNLDDPIQKYLHDFPTYNTTLTIRHFIHHTSGVRDNLTLWGLAGNSYLDHIDKGEMYALIRRQKTLNFEPGEKYLYSNSCYFLLGLIIEKVSGQTLHEFAQHNIFGPLGMHCTFFGDDKTRIIKNRAFSYMMQDGYYKNQILRYDLVGSGGVYSNIKDLYLWDQNFYHNKLGKGTQVLIDKMHEDGKLNDGKSCGYAFAIQNGYYRGLKTVSHGGALAGYRSYLLRFPDQKWSVVLLGNVTPIPIEKLSYTLAEVFLENQMTSPLVSTQINQSLSVESDAEQPTMVTHPGQYVGEFYSDELKVNYIISEQAGQLYCSINGKQLVPMHGISRDLFKMNNNIQLKYTRRKNNKINGFTVNAGRVTDLLFVKK